MRRALIAAATAAAMLVPVPAAATMPTVPGTSDKLDEMATIVEGMHGSSRIVDQRIADLLRPFAATEGVTVPVIAGPYTQLPESALKIRPPVWKMAQQELSNGWYVAGFLKWDSTGLKVGHEVGGRSQANRALAMDAALLRAWAQDMREAGQ